MPDPDDRAPEPAPRRAALADLSLDRGLAGPRRRRRLPRALGWILVLGLAIGGYLGFSAWTAVPGIRLATVLRTSPVAEREITTANGYVVARTRASVASKTQGRLERVLVDEGELVAAGQLLAVVEHDELSAAVREAEAMLERARRALPAAEAVLAEAAAALRSAEAGIGERSAAVAEAQATAAERDAAYRRIEDLVQRQIQSGAELDRAREARDVAASRVALATAALATARTDLDRAGAAVEVQRRQVEVVRQDAAAAEAVLERTRATERNAFIEAPFAGMVLRREAEPGEVVSPANTGASGSKTAVVTLADFATLEIEVDVYERDIARIGAATPCRVVLDAYPDRRLPARVRLLRPTADRTRATVQVYVEFDAVPDFARPEMGARVTFYEVGTDPLVADELSVPTTAVVRDGSDREGVFVVHGRAVRFVPAAFGAVRDGRREVRSGLDPGQKVCVDPGPDLRDGMQVTVEGG
jgi:RND family efflux transporter MFP subunit